MLQGRVETVTVETKNGPVRINKSEYDAEPKKYKLAKNVEPDNTAPDNGQKGEKSLDKPLPSNELLPNAEPNNTERRVVTEPVEQGEKRFVAKDGKRFYVVNEKGERVQAEGIDHENGYEKEPDAWEANLKATQNQQAAAPQV